QNGGIEERLWPRRPGCPAGTPVYYDHQRIAPGHVVGARRNQPALYHPSVAHPVKAFTLAPRRSNALVRLRHLSPLADRPDPYIGWSDERVTDHGCGLAVAGQRNAEPESATLRNYRLRTHPEGRDLAARRIDRGDAGH